MNESKKYIAYLTYKAYTTIERSGYLHELNSKLQIQWQPTHYVYMNMMGGWSEEECDDVIYFQEVY